MWRAYGGFTFAFYAYQKIGFTELVDGDAWAKAVEAHDPISYIDTLEGVAKQFQVSADDQFMMSDWSNIWYQNFTGEKHLLILPNNDHGIESMDVVLTNWANFVRSLANPTIEERPNFEYTHSSSDGKMTVTINNGFKPSEVLLWSAQTVSTTMRDFRW